MQKVERLKTIYETIAPYITRNESSWKEYLTFAARLHKHTFDTALLVYAQNPNVTALASTAQWNRVGRYVNRGEKGIAVCEYSNAKLTLSHLFDISQTNGKSITLTDWNISENMQSEIVKRMSSSETTFTGLLNEYSLEAASAKYGRYLSTIRGSLSDGHIFSELPESGLEAQFVELLSDSITYMTAKRCGLADEDILLNDGMCTISHFNTIPLIAALGSAVTALSKDILLEIEHTIKNINYERTTQNERTLDKTRIYRERRDTLPESANLERQDSRPAARTVRENGDGVPQTESLRPIYSFENGWESDGDTAQGTGRSDRENRNTDTANAGNRSTTQNRGHIGESKALQQPEAVSGGNRDTGDRADSKVTADAIVPVSEQSNTREQEPSHDGSLSLPLAEYLEHMMLTTLFYSTDFFSRLRYINTSGDSNERKTERIKAAYLSEGDKSGVIEGTPVSITANDESLTFHIGNDGTYDCSFEWNTMQELVRGYIENGSFPEQAPKDNAEEKQFNDGKLSAETTQLPFSDVPSQNDTQLSFFDITHDTDIIQENEESVHESEIPETNDKLQAEPITTTVPEIVSKQITHNFRYTEDMDLYPSGAKSKYKANITAIKLLKTIESEHRTATPEEQIVLARYVGWGGLANAFNEKASDWTQEHQELKLLLTLDEYKAAMESTLTAYYTEPELIKQIYSTLQRFGFVGGSDRRILDPAMGTGNFYSVLPNELTGTKLYGTELDSITARIAKLLYPEANIQSLGYENTQFEDNSFDIILGNIPFNGIKVYDERYNKHNFMIHDYFVAKSLDLLKPNGIIAFITSKGTMDKKDTSVRRYIAERAELIGAVRLPNTAFKAIAGTEVTADILFLQKRPKPIKINRENEPEWINTEINRENGWISYNSYYHTHPEMILGTMTADRSMYGREDGTACIAPKDYDLYSELEKALSNLSASFSAAPDITAETYMDEDNIITEPSDYTDAPEGTRNYTFVVQDDKVYYCENNTLILQNLSTTKAARVKGLCAIRDELLDVINMQSHSYEEHELKAKQAILNRVYDTFYAKYGAINSRANSMVFSDDDQYPLLRSIENEIKESDGSIRYEKASIFFKATIHPHTVPTHVDTAEEALYLSLNTKLKIDLRYMSELTGKEPAELLEELGDKVFLNPEKYYGNALEGWETAEEYLSGYVKDKLLYARNKAEESPELFTRNVTALEAAQPIPLTPADIDYSIGAPWIPLEYYQQFMYETFDTPIYRRDRITLNYMEYTTVWHVVNKSYDSSSVKVTQTYGTSRRSAYEIFEDCLNLQSSTVKDKVQYTDPLTGEQREKYVINNAETRIARSKQAQIKEAFAAWLWKDNERKEVLLNIYNDRFNTLVPREYDGSHLIFPSMNEEMKLRPHQLNFAARVIYSGTGLAAHEVGAGKTVALIAAGMYMKNIGAIKKPMYVVPNPLVGQWAAEFYRFFPNAKLLVSTVEDFSAKNRNRYVSRIAMGDYDAVILAHSQFEKIPISHERQKRMLQGQIDDISNAIIRAKEEKGDNWTIKQMVAFQKNLEKRLKELSAEAKKDDLLTFEQLGVDFMFVDEAHMFKNCFTFTKLSRVAGVNTSSSQRAFDMLLKCQYLQEANNGRGVVFATGTPISNSMSEMFTMMRYLEPNELLRQGLSDFDSWAATYGEITSSLEITPEGSGYRMRQRFSKFHNLPELMRTFRLVSDIQTADMLNLPRPEIRGGKAEVISTPATAYQHGIMDDFVERAEAIRNKKVDPTVDNMLKLTGEARLMAIDPRLIDADAPSDPDTKLNLCIDKVYEIWHDTETDKLTQLVFCDCGTPKADEFNVYDEMKRVLTSKGVPENEVVFIHDTKTEIQRQEIFEKTRNGDIRILIGSTGKLGTGVNVQDRGSHCTTLMCPGSRRM